MSIRVLEVDQWTATADNIEEFSLGTFDLSKVSGGDSRAAQEVFGGRAVVRDVEEDWVPPMASVWFKADPVSGRLTYWKGTYDSSG